MEGTCQNGSMRMRWTDAETQILFCSCLVYLKKAVGHLQLVQNQPNAAADFMTSFEITQRPRSSLSPSYALWIYCALQVLQILCSWSHSRP